MRLSIRHDTVYRYATPVRYSMQYLRLTPRADAGQRILVWRIEAPGRNWMQTDAFGNDVTVLAVSRPHDELRISVSGTVETSLAAGTPLPNESRLPPEAFLVPTPLTEADDAIVALAAQSFSAERSRLDGATTLMHAIADRVAYEPGTTDADHTAAQALGLGRGVCQDHTHIFIAAVRAAGVPVRYVSGYLDTGDPGHVASHAWAEVWVDGRGWIGFDVTHRQSPGDRYCRLAVGRDYLDASPVRGMRQGGSEERLEVAVRVSADQ